MARTSSFFDLREAFAEPGCALCRLAARDGDRYLEALLWESVNDAGLRDAIRQARGFCREHSQALVRPGASLGVAIIARDVLQDVLGALDKVDFQASPWSPRRVYQALVNGESSEPAAERRDELAPKAPCPACIYVAQMERIYVDALLEHLLAEDGLLADYRASDGLCLQHFGRALGRAHQRAAFDALVEAERAILQALVDQLSEAIRKSDWQFQDEPKGDEMKAWLKALAALGGS